MRKQDQCYQLCGCCIVCHCRDDGQLTQQSAAFSQLVDKAYIQAFAGKLSGWILSIVVFNVEQNFNENFTFFIKLHAYK